MQCSTIFIIKVNHIQYQWNIGDLTSLFLEPATTIFHEQVPEDIFDFNPSFQAPRNRSRENNNKRWRQEDSPHFFKNNDIIIEHTDTLRNIEEIEEIEEIDEISNTSPPIEKSAQRNDDQDLGDIISEVPHDSFHKEKISANKEGISVKSSEPQSDSVFQRINRFVCDKDSIQQIDSQAKQRRMGEPKHGGLRQRLTSLTQFLGLKFGEKTQEPVITTIYSKYINNATIFGRRVLPTVAFCYIQNESSGIFGNVMFPKKPPFNVQESFLMTEYTKLSLKSGILFVCLRYEETELPPIPLPPIPPAMEREQEMHEEHSDAKDELSKMGNSFSLTNDSFDQNSEESLFDRPFLPETVSFTGEVIGSFHHRYPQQEPCIVVRECTTNKLVEVRFPLHTFNFNQSKVDIELERDNEKILFDGIGSTVKFQKLQSLPIEAPREKIDFTVCFTMRSSLEVLRESDKEENTAFGTTLIGDVVLEDTTEKERRNIWLRTATGECYLLTVQDSITQRMLSSVIQSNHYSPLCLKIDNLPLQSHSGQQTMISQLLTVVITPAPILITEECNITIIATNDAPHPRLASYSGVLLPVRILGEREESKKNTESTTRMFINDISFTDTHIPICTKCEVEMKEVSFEEHDRHSIQSQQSTSQNVQTQETDKLYFCPLCESLTSESGRTKEVELRFTVGYQDQDQRQIEVLGLPKQMLGQNCLMRCNLPLFRELLNTAANDTTTEECISQLDKIIAAVANNKDSGKSFTNLVKLFSLSCIGMKINNFCGVATTDQHMVSNGTLFVTLIKIL